jgi:hypothetical protein
LNCAGSKQSGACDHGNAGQGKSDGFIEHDVLPSSGVLPEKTAALLRPKRRIVCGT